ncbi:hypothetical protein DAPPUDRAFT_303060 [Daphnia pulex]|uniref:Lipase domain-containing protein n=1 Tax=Daphnia pulex TaxID=6669 RepID=E9FU18_DAPPU|nr:hypothetical protein DAPPUDRAFT_303060 [Daphnia pulex]|eukprot:EFX89463.1 hypothetical protein DAPPUDRAFT_303060 [Daphnia pulex]
MKFLQALLLSLCTIFCVVQGKSIGDGDVMASKADPIEFTHFNLWTRNNPVTLQELFIGDATSLAASNFDSSKPTKVFAHGWRMNGYDNNAVFSLRDEFLAKEDCNFIAVDWEELANNLNYYSSAANTQPVGILTGDFINFLISQGTNVNLFHVIGFSLGAHVAGKAGALANGLIPRITGLDPAYPGFSVGNTDERLDVTDAQFVDVMHTNSASLLNGGLSFPVSIGHVDFWPNGGIVQPGCILTGSDILAIATGCSHSRAYQYFAETINGGRFTSIRCTSYEEFDAGLCNGNQQDLMGLPVSLSATGDYYLNTFDAPPFSMG